MPCHQSQPEPVGLGSSLVSDPVSELAKAVARAISKEVEQVTVPVQVKGKTKATSSRAQPREPIALEAHLAQRVEDAIRQSLEARTDEGKSLRMSFIATLAQAELGDQGWSKVAQDAPRVGLDEKRLSTAEVATMLGTSRPYVVMLCDFDRLGDIVKTEGGHRRIRLSAVEDYLAARAKLREDAKTPMEVAEALGMYEIPEDAIGAVVRGGFAQKHPGRRPRASRKS